MAPAQLGLTDHHALQAINFMRFCRYKRVQRLKAVDHCFQDLKDSRLYEDTYTLDEITEMMDGLLSVVRGEMESELLNSSHTSILLLQQILTQAEKWHLKLSADMSELENRELLEQIADFEEKEASLSPTTSALDFKKQTLEPLNETGGVALLQMEIERLKEENQKISERSRSMESHVTSCMKDNELLRSQIKQLGAKPVAAANVEELKKLESEMNTLKSDLSSNIQSKSTENEKLAADLTTTMHELLKVQEQLDLTEKELDKKFRETGAYRNLRDMLAKKNEQIKDLRKKLGKYESTD